jgi:DNA-binding NarL/FixJ family response regulator
VDNCVTFGDGLELAITRSNTVQLVGRGCNAEEVIESGAMISADVVVIDIDLPGQSGFKLSQWLAKQQPQLSMLLLCYWDWDVYLVRARAASAWGVLLRPTPTLELVQSTSTKLSPAPSR